jgi:hypothetical protein
MTFNLTTAIADDYLLFDGTQTVTLRTLDGDSASAAGVTSSPLSYKQMAMVGGLVAEDQAQTFSLPKATCGGLVPEQNGTITDENSVVWRILSVDNKTLDSRYVCPCVRTHDADSAPFQPADLADNGTASANGLVKLAWTNRNAGDAGTTATVQYSSSAAFTSPTNLSVGTITAAAITYQYDVPTGTLYFRVRHVNAKGNSPWSASISIAVPAALSITSSATPSLAENTSFVVTGTATGGRAPYVFTIVGGADAALLTITDPNVAFIVSPDFEVPGDANADNNYEFTLRVTDADLNTVDQNVSITVTDVGD